MDFSSVLLAPFTLPDASDLVSQNFGLVLTKDNPLTVFAVTLADAKSGDRESSGVGQALNVEVRVAALYPRSTVLINAATSRPMACG